MNDKPVRITKTETLLTAIEGLGEDKNSLPIGIRTAELAAKTGVPANSIQMLLAPHVASGRLCVCRVTLPGRPQQNEYRRGAGVPSCWGSCSRRAPIFVGVGGVFWGGGGLRGHMPRGPWTTHCVARGPPTAWPTGHMACGPWLGDGVVWEVVTAT